MDNYYFLAGKNSNQVASAFAPKGTKLDHELIPMLDGKTTLPFELNLVKLTIEKNGLNQNDNLFGLEEIWLDYQPSNLAWPIMSGKLKKVIENNLTGKEMIDWVSCKINGNGENRSYYILRFNKLLDVLDLEKTTFVSGTDHIIRPVFSLDKIKSYNIFTKPSSNGLWKITPGIYISEALKKAIQKEKLTGIVFEKAPVT